ERTIRVVAGQRELVFVHLGKPCHDDLPVRLNGNGTRVGRTRQGEGRTRHGAESGGHRATYAEAGVERAIAVVARQCEGISSVGGGVPGDDNSPVRLYGHGIRLGKGVSDAGDYFATRAESGVERTIGVIARESKTGRTVNYGPPSRDDFPVPLESQGSRPVVRA